MANCVESICAHFWPDFSDESRAAMHRTYGDPPSLDEFADLILVHELVHLVPRAQSLPTRWHEELFANLGAVGYFASVEPDALPVYMAICHAGCEIPPSRVVRSTPAEMASSYEDGGFANYVWYQCRLTVAAERLWNAHGVEALRALQAGKIEIAGN